MSLDMTITMDEAIETLEKLRGEQLVEAKKEFVLQMALEFLKMMKHHSPVRTGRMRSSMDIFDHPTGLVIGPTVQYAKFVALGTRFMKAQPFHEWAFNDVMQRAPTILDAVARRFFVKELI